MSSSVKAFWGHPQPIWGSQVSSKCIGWHANFHQEPKWRTAIPGTKFTCPKLGAMCAPRDAQSLQLGLELHMLSSLSGDSPAMGMPTNDNAMPLQTTWNCDVNIFPVQHQSHHLPPTLAIARKENSELPFSLAAICMSPHENHFPRLSFTPDCPPFKLLSSLLNFGTSTRHCRRLPPEQDCKVQRCLVKAIKVWPIACALFAPIHQACKAPQVFCPCLVESQYRMGHCQYMGQVIYEQSQKRACSHSYAADQIVTITMLLLPVDLPLMDAGCIGRTKPYAMLLGSWQSNTWSRTRSLAVHLAQWPVLQRAAAPMPSEHRHSCWLHARRAWNTSCTKQAQLNCYRCLIPQKLYFLYTPACRPSLGPSDRSLIWSQMPRGSAVAMWPPPAHPYASELLAGNRDITGRSDDGKWMEKGMLGLALSKSTPVTRSYIMCFVHLLQDNLLQSRSNGFCVHMYQQTSCHALRRNVLPCLWQSSSGQWPAAGTCDTKILHSSGEVRGWSDPGHGVPRHSPGWGDNTPCAFYC